MSVLVTELNETGDIYYFLQQVHKEYCKLVCVSFICPIYHY